MCRDPIALRIRASTRLAGECLRNAVVPPTPRAERGDQNHPFEDFIHMKKIFAIAASALVLAAPAISAQEEGPTAEAVVAYMAVNWSTVGAIPLATNTPAPAGGMTSPLPYGRLPSPPAATQRLYS